MVQKKAAKFKPGYQYVLTCYLCHVKTDRLMNKIVYVFLSLGWLFLMLTLPVRSLSQNKIYLYYLDEQMQIVPKEQATIVGKGSPKDSVFLVQYYTLATDRPFLIEMFKDSSLSVLHGVRVAYHNNRQKAETAVYQNNMLHGLRLQWDTLGRTTDSALYYDDMPTYLTRFGYDAGGRAYRVFEFDNTYAKKRPDEKATVMTRDGSVIPASVWKELLYGGKYAFRQDKVSPDRYMIFRLSDKVFEKSIADAPRPEESKFFKTGQSFGISETDINGNKLRSRDLKGKVLVINYWFIDCPPCRREIPELNELVKKYEDNGNVKFIGIALDDRSSLKDFLKRSPFHYQIVANGRPAAEKYGIHLYPTHVIVDGEGRVRFHTVSSPRQLFYWMEKTINELLEEQKTGL